MNNCVNLTNDIITILILNLSVENMLLLFSCSYIYNIFSIYTIYMLKKEIVQLHENSIWTIWATLKRSAFSTWHFCNCCKILTSAPKEFMFVLYNNVVTLHMILSLWVILHLQDAFIKIVRYEGVSSLWSGLPPTL